MDQDDLGPDYWRGDIDPSSRTEWFKSYESMMKPYLEMANTDKVTGFTISLELASLATATQWPSFITWAKKLYHGQLVFATSWKGSDPGGKGEVHAGTSVGMDSYPNLKQSTPSWSVAQLLAAWNSYLKSKPYGTADSNVTIDEVGIEAVDGAYKTPSIAVNGKFNQSIQVNWFNAACEFYKAHKQNGIYFWGPDFTFNDGNLTSAPVPANPNSCNRGAGPPSKRASNDRDADRALTFDASLGHSLRPRDRARLPSGSCPIAGRPSGLPRSMTSGQVKSKIPSGSSSVLVVASLK